MLFYVKKSEKVFFLKTLAICYILLIFLNIIIRTKVNIIYLCKIENKALLTRSHLSRQSLTQYIIHSSMTLEHSRNGTARHFLTNQI